MRRLPSRLAQIALTLLLSETAAIAQSAAGHVAAASLLDACRMARIADVIFIGRPLEAVRGGESAPVLVQVDTAFRGVTTSTVQVTWDRESTIAPKQSYLFYGYRESADSIVRLAHHLPESGRAAQLAIQLFTFDMPQRGYITLLGLVEAGSHPDRQPSHPLTGLRIRVRSEGYARDLVTQPGGTFYAAGVPPGRFDLTPALPETLKVFDPRTLTYSATADECVLEVIFIVSRP